jgi:DMSO/TMAO reductase YedYZ molybdopterin-dependent catalytic subunit
MTRPGWLVALLIGCMASGIALVLQSILRDTWQIRTLPERVMEWLLLFVPLDVFERGVQQLGGNAKEVALAGTVVGMAVILTAIGTLTVRAGWTSWQLLGMGLALWGVAMGVVMPVTGAGFLARGLLISPLLTNAGYLLMFLGYGCVLVGGRLLLSRRGFAQRRTIMAERRALLAGLVGTVMAGGVARLVGRDGGLVVSTLPLASAPTLPLPRPAARSLPTQAAVAPGAATIDPSRITVIGPATPTPLPLPTAAPPPTLEPLPNPPPPRRVARDKDGALTAAGRPKGELAPPITANDDFYVVTKNAVADPMVDAASWRLFIDGEVHRPVQVDYRTLRALPAVEVTRTLECISNLTTRCNQTSFGCDLISTARWKGARLSDVLDLAGGLKSTAAGLAFLAIDEFSAGVTPDIVDDPETLIVYEMNGAPLPREHGFPARLLVPGRYGMKDPKWLAGVRAMTTEHQGWYEQRNWNKFGIVKTMSRIDMPVDGARLPAGEQRLAGIAYAGDRGIKKVEFSVDDGGTWETATILESMPGKDAMVRWESTFVVPTDGSVTITTRATDGTGELQTEDFQLPQPDGASGRDAITVSAA